LKDHLGAIEASFACRSAEYIRGTRAAVVFADAAYHPNEKHRGFIVMK
jgi:hypothetical protein